MKTPSVILFIILFSASIQAQKQYKHLVFEGAGIKGIAYSGAIEQLEEYGKIKEVTKIGGTSAGAITAMMLSIGYTSEEIYNIISSTKFQKFNNGGCLLIGGFYRLKNRFGWYKSKNFESWLERIIEAKTGDPDITFKELKDNGFKDLYVTGTCLNRQELLIFSSNTYPLMKIKDAIKVSMSIPIYFEACFIDCNGKLYKNPDNIDSLDIVVDGGILGNYPITLFDDIKVDTLGSEYRIPNSNTLGIRIDTDRQIVSDQGGNGLVDLSIKDFKSFIEAFYILSLETLNRYYLTSEDWERTISVSSCGIGPRIKRLTNEDKQKLRNSGKEAVIQFFE
jgi:NTE family protein